VIFLLYKEKAGVWNSSGMQHICGRYTDISHNSVGIKSENCLDI
jgi:hypothetical protein